MANKIQVETLETLNTLCRFIHFDPNAKKGILTKEQLSIRTGIGYNKLARLMNDPKFAVLFDENVLGSIVLSGEVPAFLDEYIDLATPYVPVTTCNDPSHTAGQKSQTPQMQHKPKIYHTKFYSEQTLNALLSDEGRQILEALLREPNPVKPGKDQTHTWWQLQNLVNYIQTVLDLVKSPDPAVKAKEIIDEPDKFPPLGIITGSESISQPADLSLADLPSTQVTLFGLTMTKEQMPAYLVKAEEKAAHGDQFMYEEKTHDWKEFADAIRKAM